MLWLNENRKKIVDENPGTKVTEIAKKGGELWRDLKDKSVRIHSKGSQHKYWKGLVLTQYSKMYYNL